MQDDNFHVFSLFSGSRGNGIYITCGDTRILVDAGLCAKSVRSAIAGVDRPDVLPDAIFVTHEHSDHVKGIPILSRTVPVHMIEDCAPFITCDLTHRHVHPSLFTQTVGCMEVTSFVTPHDSHGSVGYVVRMPGHSVGIATDLGYLPGGILGLLCTCDAVVLESNYDEDMLRTGRYPYSLKQRILSDYGHLSNRDCAEGVRALCGAGVQNILLSHLSEENNTPTLAFRASSEAAEAVAGNRVRLAVADRIAPTRLV